MTAPDPYRPPDAPLNEKASERPRPVRGVLLGMLVDWGGTIFLSIAFAVVYGAMLASRGLSEADIISTFESAGLGSAFGILNTVMGTAMSFLGGWICVRVGNSPSLMPPAVLAGLGVFIGLLIGGGGSDVGVTMMLMLFSVSATMIGAWLAGQGMRAQRTNI